jgi:hypothetical protein
MSIGFGDRGLMPFDPDVQIFEPNQRAIIAWNGNEQILLLSTDIYASESTMVLEVLPLPSEPQVKKGRFETFLKVTNIINTKILNAYQKRGAEGLQQVKTPGGVVTWHEQIGAHDISVIQLVESKTFVAWVRDYLDSLDVRNDIISDTMAALIEEYITDGFVWFVFDLITLGDVTVSNEPIQYRFTTELLFYPLRITRTGNGNTSIQLVILTPQLLNNFPALPKERIDLRHEPVTVTSAELREIDEDMYALLREYEAMKLRIWNIEGALKSFDQDLIAH